MFVSYYINVSARNADISEVVDKKIRMFMTLKLIILTKCGNNTYDFVFLVVIYTGYGWSSSIYSANTQDMAK